MIALNCGKWQYLFISAVVLSLSALSVTASYDGVKSPDQVASAEGRFAESVQYSFHKMTYDEMSAIRDSLGVKNPQAEYNVMINGHGTGLSPPSSEIYERMVGEVNVLDSIGEMDLSSVPTSFDLSTGPTFPAVGNQSSQPSCAAWAATYYAYGFAEASDLGWNEASTGNPEQLMSPGWTYNKVNRGRDSGSSMDENMFVIRDWGAATLATMPYDDSEYLDWGSPSAFREAPEHRAEEIFYIPYSGSATIDEIRALVSEGTLVTFGIDAGQYDAAFADDNFVISAAEYSSTSLNHAQTVVGFDDAVEDDGDIGAFKVVNSWGPEWGDGGFYWITYETILELGTLNLLYLNYIMDIPDYEPELIAVWHFNSPPPRSAALEVGFGPAASPIASKTPYSAEDRSASHQYPAYMCLDASEFADHYAASSGEPFFLSVGQSSSRGTISSFKVEAYGGEFVPGTALRSSPQSKDVPRATPGIVTVVLPLHETISLAEALDFEPATVVHSSDVQWVGVNHEYAVDGDSLQSGDVADGETTTFAISVAGPAELSFMWKVSSESGGDMLSFEILDAGVSGSISGDQDWTEKTFAIGDGPHTLAWSYSKDSTVSGLQDTAWLDGISISSSQIDFTLEPYYLAMAGEQLVVTPLDVYNPASMDLRAWYDWGDGSPIDDGDPESDYSASHVYPDPGVYELNVSIEDEYLNRISRISEVRVDNENRRPTIQSFAISPHADYYEPYSTVWFEVGVLDPEGGVITVSVEIPILDVELVDTEALDPNSVTLFSFEYACPEGNELPYEVLATVSDEAEHLDEGGWDWQSLSLLVNSPPLASLSSEGESLATGAVATFDASGSFDEETLSESLEVRWDWETDGTWDTDWSTDTTASHAFPDPGTYTVTVQVRDSSSLTATASIEVVVTGEPIPEFSMLLIPVLGVATLLLLVVRFRRSRR